MLILIIHKDGREPIQSQQKDPFAGIEIDMNSSEDFTPKTKDIHIEGISGSEIVDSSTIPTTFVCFTFSMVVQHRISVLEKNRSGLNIRYIALDIRDKETHFVNLSQ